MEICEHGKHIQGIYNVRRRRCFVARDYKMGWRVIERPNAFIRFESTNETFSVDPADREREQRFISKG